MRKRRKVWKNVAAVFVLVVLTAGVIFLCQKETKEEKKGSGAEQEAEQNLQKKLPDDQEEFSETPEKGTEEQKKLKFYDFHFLEPYLDGEKINTVQEKIREYISKKSSLSGTSEVSCLDIMTETEYKLIFYCTLDLNQETEEIPVLQCTWDKITEDASFIFVEISEEILDQEARKKEEWFVTNEAESGADEEDPLPKQWTYEEEDTTPVTIVNEDILEEKISVSESGQLQEELLLYLKEEGEFRRELEFDEESYKNSSQGMSFFLDFKTERIDQKIIHAEKIRGKNNWSFELVKEEK